MISLALPVLFKLLLPYGITEAEGLENSGIDSTDLSQQMDLSADQLNIICANAMRLTGDKDLGIKLGMHLDLVSYTADILPASKSVSYTASILPAPR